MFKYDSKSLMLLAGVFLIGSSDVFSQSHIDTNLYTGVYQLKSDATINFMILERDNKIIARNVWGVEELKVGHEHAFSVEKWGVSGQFLDINNGQFQSYEESVNGIVQRFKRIQVEPSLAFIYDTNPTFTDFFSKNSENCSDDHLLSAVNETTAYPEKIRKLVTQLKSDRYGWGKQDSLLIYKDNKLLVEEYFNSWKRDEPHQIQSVSKSLTSLLVGALVTEKKLPDVNQPIIDYLPRYAYLLNGDKSNITLANFLNMSAGLEWDERSSSYTDPNNVRAREMASDDSVAFTLQRRLKQSPGEHFSYSGGYVTVVGEVIASVAKQPTAADYASNSALKALCFKNSYWSKLRDGRTDTGGGAMMRPIDMLKLGKLMLDDGQWQGKQLIDKQWVQDSMDPASNPYKGNYTYFWIHEDYHVGEKTYSAVLARGWGGQEIVIIKELDLIVVKTASNFTIQPQLSTMMRRFILPSFVD